MAKVRNFYNFIKSNEKHELYIYGAIVDGVEKWEESDCTFDDVREKLEEMSDGSTLDIYINSPGGSVFTTQGMIAMLSRSKERGITINAWCDGIAASCASWLPMIADNIYVYPHSIMMIHSPMTSVRMSNSKQLIKEIEILDKIQEDVIIPLYLEKAKEGVTADKLREMMEAETWLNANEIDELFNVQLVPEERKIACMGDLELFNQYKNTPKNVLELLNKMDSEVKDLKKIKDEVAVEETVTEEVVETEVVEEVVDEIEETIEEEVTEETTVEEPAVEETVEETTEVEEESEIEEVVEETTEAEDIVDEKDSKINELEVKVSELENHLKVANEKVISLSDKVAEMQPLVDKYNNEVEAKIKAENEALLAEKKNYYKNKFEQLGAKAKFETDEVQNLLNKCVEDEKSLSMLNLMVVDMISIDKQNVIIDRVEETFEIENLIPDMDEIGSKYGFR